MLESSQEPRAWEIIVTHRNEGAQPPSIWTNIERWAKVLSIVAIPVIVVIIGSSIQNILSQREVRRDYVELSLSILSQPKQDVDGEIWNWAVDLLQNNSPTKFSKQVVADLKAGKIGLLPQNVEAILSEATGTTATAVSLEKKLLVAGGQDGTVYKVELGTGNILTQFVGHSAAITSIAFSPNEQYLLTGSSNGIATLWDLTQNEPRQVYSWEHDGPIVDVSFTTSGFPITQTEAQISVWDINTGNLFSRFPLNLPEGR